MSRCFPYPPPGYLVKRDNSDALIESIKLPSLTEKAKAERKAEKKEKKRDKKEKKHHDKKDKKHHEKKHKRSDEKEHKSDKETAYLKGKSLLNGGGEEAEQRSGVTEEHGQPAMPSYSSDSTENSNKRRRPNLPEYGISSSGSTLRIRFKRKEEAEPVVANEKPLAAINADVAPKKPLAAINAGVAPKKPLAAINAGVAPKKPLAAINAGVAPKKPLAAINAIAPKKPLAAINAGVDLKQVDSNAIYLREQQASTSARNEVARPDKEQVCSTSGMSREASQLFVDKFQIAPVVPHVSKKLKSASKRYNELFENWVPPTLLNTETDDDQDWLFQRKEKKPQERPKVEGVAASGCSLSSTMWPCAQFLPEVDVYALPFTVPY